MVDTQILTEDFLVLVLVGRMEQLQVDKLDPRVETWTTCSVSRSGSRTVYLVHFFNVFKRQCGEKGHYANHCRNRNVPGNRGGIEIKKRPPM